jgi:hypothetical protein
MSPTKRSQSGSAGTVLVLAIIAILAWWQWDRIVGVFTGSGDTVAEVTGFSCTSQTGGTRFEGRVRNLSNAPVEFRALVNTQDTSGRRADSREATIRPAPVPPQSTGAFYGDGPPLPDGGSCKLANILNAETGYPVPYRRR